MDQNPFIEITVTNQTRLYVTFLSWNCQSSLKVADESLGSDFKIISASAGEVCSVVTLTPQSGTIKTMDLLEKEFGRNITTRNWNTVTRMAKM